LHVSLEDMRQTGGDLAGTLGEQEETFDEPRQQEGCLYGLPEAYIGNLCGTINFGFSIGTANDR
jgi:hypothetical protein